VGNVSVRNFKLYFLADDFTVQTKLPWTACL